MDSRATGTPVATAATVQAPAADLGPGEWDVVVAGAGPAGSTAAACLARAGHSVLLLDRHRFPREKACGDGLIADAVAALGRLGVLAEVEAAAYASSRVSIYSPRRFRVDVPGRFLTLKRERLDAILASAAVAAGATFAQGEVRRIDEVAASEVEVHVRGLERAIRARAAVLATGADQSVAAGAGLVGREPPSAVAMRCYVTSRQGPDDLVVSFDREVLPGYAWIFPLGGGEYNVGCGLFQQGGRKGPERLGEILRRFLERFPEARAMMAQATSRSPVRGAALRCGLSVRLQRASTRVALAGESLGATVPFTGEGVGKAMETAELVASAVSEALSGGDGASIARAVAAIPERLGPRYAGYRAAQAWFARAWLADAMAWLAVNSRTVRASAAGMLNETIEPGEIFSLRGVARGAWGILRSRMRSS